MWQNITSLEALLQENSVTTFARRSPAGIVLSRPLSASRLYSIWPTIYATSSHVLTRVSRKNSLRDPTISGPIFWRAGTHGAIILPPRFFDRPRCKYSLATILNTPGDSDTFLPFRRTVSGMSPRDRYRGSLLSEPRLSHGCSSTGWRWTSDDVEIRLSHLLLYAEIYESWAPKFVRSLDTRTSEFFFDSSFEFREVQFRGFFLEFDVTIIEVSRVLRIFRGFIFSFKKWCNFLKCEFDFDKFDL